MVLFTSQAIAPQQSLLVVHFLPLGWQHAFAPVDWSSRQMESAPQHSAPLMQVEPKGLQDPEPVPVPVPPPVPVPLQVSVSASQSLLQQSSSSMQSSLSAMQAHLPSSASHSMRPQQAKLLPPHALP